MEKMPVVREVSAGGVVYRRAGTGIEVALIKVGPAGRWQLPKGLVEPGEAPEAAALREVREETGIQGELIAAIDAIEYWYAATRDGVRVRVHKTVHFFLLRGLSGETADHDWEVEEARWFEIGAAIGALAFDNERRVAERAAGMLAAEG